MARRSARPRARATNAAATKVTRGTVVWVDLSDATPPELAPSCSANGVLGVMAGTMGTLQANEVIKLVLGVGDPLVGRLLLYEALGTRFTELKVRRDPDCPICGEHAPEVPESEMGRFPDYDAFCAG